LRNHQPSDSTRLEELKEVYSGRSLYEHWGIVPKAEDAFALLGDEEMSCKAKRDREEIEAEPPRKTPQELAPLLAALSDAQPAATSDC
jgi:ATP-dependent DNA ligase